MRLLVVMGDELVLGDRGSEWATLNALVAVNGPEAIEVRVMALVHGPRPSITAGHPLGRAVARMPRWDSAPSQFYSPSESARGRLDRALQYLRGLRLRATGDIETRSPLRAVRAEVTSGGYDRVLVLACAEPRSRRLLHLDLGTRLGRVLDIPVDRAGRTDISTLRPDAPYG